MAAFYQVRQPTSLLVDPLCCNEEDIFPFWEEEAEDECPAKTHPAAAAEEAAGQVHWDRGEDGGVEESVELAALLSKEAETHSPMLFPGYLVDDPSLTWVRLDAVRWILKASARHGFTAQTALLAVGYLDRFLSSTRCCGSGGTQQQQPQQQQPWMAQLSAVACLSLAAKLEETHVPLLLDLQVEEARYVFEARTVQRMELLVLSTLGWRMGSPTPLSFIDHFLRRRSACDDRAGPISSSLSGSTAYGKAVNEEGTQLQQQREYVHLQWKFQERCHSILSALVADSRWVQFLPSVLAAATMLHALGQLRDQQSIASSAVNLQNQIMNLLNVTEDQVKPCSVFILDAISNGSDASGGDGGAAGNKRKRPHISSPPSMPPSPRGVVDATFSCDSYSSSFPVSASTSVSSSPDLLPPRGFKRLHSVGAVGGDEEQCCPRPLFDGVLV